MAISVYNWQPPDTDSIVRLALAAKENEQRAAAQQIEQQRLQQKQAADLALQIRQERRIADAQNFKHGLDVAKELRDARLSDAKAKYYAGGGRAGAAGMATLAPVFLPEDGGGSLPGDPVPVPTMASADATPGALLQATDTPSLADQVSLDNPAPFSFATGTPSPTAEPFSAAATHDALALSPAALLGSAAPLFGSDGEAVPALPPGDPSAMAPTDFAGMLRGGGGAEWDNGALAEGDPEDTPATWAKLRAAGGMEPWPRVPANAAGPGLSGEPDLMGGMRPGNAQTPADALRAASSQLDASARARVNAIAAMEAAGQAKPGSSAVAFQRELTATRRAEASAEKPIFRKVDGGVGRYNPETGQFDVVAPKSVGQTIDEATKGLTYNATHGTYVNPDTGAENFYYQDGSKLKIKPFDPSAHPARMVPASDGSVYPVDAQGEPLKPLPDGVTLSASRKPDIRTVPNVGEVMFSADGSSHLLIPAGIAMDAKSKQEYREAAEEVEKAKLELAGQEKLAQDRPPGWTKEWFGGGSQRYVDAAKKKLDAAAVHAASFHEAFPQLKQTVPGGVSPALSAPGGAPAPAAPAGMVSVISPAGKTGKIPAAQLQAALAAGYKQK